MKNKSTSIPVAMLIKKFYCADCGNRLLKNPKKRIVRRGDADYREHSTIGGMQLIGDVELTEYDFKCHHCGKITSFDEQCVIEKIQKKVGSHTLSQSEIAQYTQQAEADLKKRRRITDIVVKVIFILLAVFVGCILLKTNGFF